jgi:hypothetical protein
MADSRTPVHTLVLRALAVFGTITWTFQSRGDQSPWTIAAVQYPSSPSSPAQVCAAIHRASSVSVA